MSSTTADSVNSRIDGWASGVVVSNSNSTTAASPPAGGIGAAAGAWDTAANRDAAISTINNIRIDLDSVKTQLDALLAVLRTNKIIPQ